MVNQKLNYAVQINTGTNITDTTIGLENGVFRFVTGRPDYNGIAPYPSWGSNELYNGDITDKWYQGYITEDGISNPSRDIDLTQGGDYGTLSQFTIRIRNNQLFWKKLVDHRISLVNKKISAYVIINDTFYQIWSGLVANTPRSTKEFIIECADDSQSIHKDMPKEYIGTVPKQIVLGDVEYIKAIRTKESKIIPLSANSTSAPLYSATYTSGNLNITNTLDNIKHFDLKLLTQGKQFSTNELSGKYLKISYFEKALTDTATGRSADPDNLSYIYSNDPTASGLTTVRVKHAPKATPPFKDDQNIEKYTYEYNKINSLSVNDFTMHLDCMDISSTYVVNNTETPYDLNEIYQFNEELNEYVKLPITATSNGDGTINLLLPSKINGEQLEFYQKTDYTLNAFHHYGITANRNGICVVSRLVSDNKVSYVGYVYIDDASMTYSGLASGYINAMLELPGIRANVSGFMLETQDAGSKRIYYVNTSVVGEEIAYGDLNRSGYTGNMYMLGVTPSNDYGTTRSLSISGVPYDSITEFKDAITSGVGKIYELGPAYGLNAQSGMRTCITINDTFSDQDELYIIPEITMSGFAYTNPNYIKRYVFWRAIDSLGNVVEPSEDSDDGGVCVMYDNISGNINTFYPMYDTNNPPDNETFVPALENFYEDWAVMLPGSGVFNVNEEAKTDQYGSQIFKVPESLMQKYRTGMVKSFEVTFGMRVVPHDPPLGVMQPAYSYHFKKIHCIVKRKHSLDKEIFLKSNSGTNPSNVYETFKYILETNDGIPSSGIDYNNLQSLRTSGANFNWVTGRIFNQVQNSKLYLKELCKHSQTALFPDRLGRRKFNCFLSNSGYLDHDDSVLVRDSIDSVDMSSLANVYNTFNIEYNYDYQKEKYSKLISIRNTDENSFPAQGQDYSQYVSGIHDYNIAKGIWETAHSGYLLAGTQNSPNDELSKLPYFIYSQTNNDYTSPVLYVINLINWNSRQHLNVEYSIPINSGTILTELTDTVYFKNLLYTDNQTYKGYINKIVYDTKNDQIRISAYVDPNDGFNFFFLNEIPDNTVNVYVLILDAQSLTNRDNFIRFDASLNRSVYKKMDALLART